jgi:hypothetical protein
MMSGDPLPNDPRARALGRRCAYPSWVSRRNLLVVVIVALSIMAFVATFVVGRVMPMP